MTDDTTTDLRLRLLKKLQGGNKRFAHLDATIGKSRGKLDILTLDKISEGLSKEFFKQLLSNPNLTFKISLKDVNARIQQFINDQKEKSDDQGNTNREMLEEVKNLSATKKRLEYLEANQKSEFNEFGTKSFAFGYPLLIKQMKITPDGERDVICAPLFIWYLDITRDYSTDSIIISRTDENPILFNEMLDYYLQSELKIDFSDEVQNINTEILSDGLMSELELDASIKKLMDKLSSQIDASRTSWELESVPKDRKAASDYLKAIGKTESILDGGIFGVFKSGKQSIINDLKNLVQLETLITVENLGTEYAPEHVFTAIETDPSQHQVIENLTKTQNLIIQGPPGTGKSQTLTALITNALANRKRTLVVCEKRTAMDIIAKNLEKCRLGDYFVTIEDVDRDRSIVVEKARKLHEFRYIRPYGINQELTNAFAAYTEAVNVVDAHHNSIAKLEEKGLGDSKYILGKYLHSTQNITDHTLLTLCAIAFGKIPFDFNNLEFKEINEELTRTGSVYRKSHTILANIPFQVIAQSNSYASDKEAITRYFTEIKESLRNLGMEATNYQNKIITENVLLIEQIHSAVKDTATITHKLLAIERTNFEWKSVLTSLQKAESDGIIELESNINIRNLNAIQAFKVEFLSNITQARSNLDEVIKEYHHHLVNAKDRIALLTEHGISSANIVKAVPITAIFSAKLKEIKNIKVDLFAEIKEANRIRDSLPGLLINTIAINEDVGKSIDNCIGELPNYIQVTAYVKKLEALTFANPESVEESKRNILVGEYLQYVVDKQFEEFSKVKDYLWTSFQKKATVSIEQSEYLRDTFNLNDLGEEFNSKDLEVLESISLNPPNSESIRAEATALANTLSISSDIYLAEIRDKTVTLLSKGDYCQAYDYSLNALEPIGHCQELIDQIKTIESLTEKTLVEIEDNLYSYHIWCGIYSQLSGEIQQTIDIFNSASIEPDSWSPFFSTLYFERLVKDSNGMALLSNDLALEKLSSNDQKIKILLLDSIAGTWGLERGQFLTRFDNGTLRFNSLYNKRGAPGQRRNSLRKIIARDIELFTSLFPVIICNPSTTASIFKLEKDLFDIVLFDEASQLRLEDTYTSLYRGKVKIVSGDEHQMPPSSYFQSAGSDEDQEYERDEDINDQETLNSESLLDYASNREYQKTMLKVHYRSDHEDLIEFSNYAFYEGKLIPITKLEEYTPIEFHRIDGTYKDHRNEDEANAIIEWLNQFLTKNERPSVGVVTLNLSQNDLIKEKVSEKRTNDPKFAQLMSELDDTGFFVKNLENIQGDERDIMLLSTTFGVKSDGSFSQNFGPLNKKKGYRLLNVLVTRAKHTFIVFTSIPDKYINTYAESITATGKDGKAIFYAYLAYAKAIADNNRGSRQSILNFLSRTTEQQPDAQSLVDLTESPFEEEVLATLEKTIDIDRIKLQYRVGSEKFRIDMVILTPDKKRPMLAIECDGYAYHSDPDAYLYDIYRQKILEGKGFKFYRIWSTNWFHDQANEEYKLKQRIQDFDEQFESTKVAVEKA